MGICWGPEVPHFQAFTASASLPSLVQFAQLLIAITLPHSPCRTQRLPSCSSNLSAVRQKRPLSHKIPLNDHVFGKPKQTREICARRQCQETHIIRPLPAVSAGFEPLEERPAVSVRVQSPWDHDFVDSHDDAPSKLESQGSAVPAWSNFRRSGEVAEAPSAGT